MCRDEWTDKGTGFCYGDVVDNGSGTLCAWITVRCEVNRALLLLRAPVRGSIRFQKQQDTLLVWSEPRRNDMALSFQDADGCACLCSFLVQVQKSVARDISVVVVTSTDEGETSEVIAGPVAFPPEPTIDNLPEVLELLATLAVFQFSRESLCAFLVGTDFIPKLAAVFTQAENDHLIAQLYNLCRIVKLLFGLNESKVIERLIADESVHGIIGSLEYDPAFPGYKANLRAHFHFDNKFKQVLPINDPEILTKIRITSRLQLLKDVLARLLDETTFGVMSSMIYINQWTIVMALQSTDYFSHIFKLYTIPYPRHSTLQRRRDGVRFIHSISLSTKGFQLPQKKTTFTTLAEKGLFAMLQFAIADSDVRIKMLGIELLAGLIELDPQLVRDFVKAQIEFVVNATLKSRAETLASSNGLTPRTELINQLQKRAKGHDPKKELAKKTSPKSALSEKPALAPEIKDNSLIQILVTLFMSKTDIGLRLQVLESLKFMLDNTDTDNGASNILGFSAANGSERVLERSDDLFIKRFYERYADSIFDIIRQASTEYQDIKTGGIPTQTAVNPASHFPKLSSRLTPQNRSLYEQVCDLLTFCIRIHGVKCQDFIAGNIRPSSTTAKEGNLKLVSKPNNAIPFDKSLNISGLENGISTREGNEQIPETQSNHKLRPNLWRGIAALLLSPHQTIQLAALRCVRQAINLLDESDLDFECENYQVFFEAINNKSINENEPENISDKKELVLSRESNPNSPLTVSIDSSDDSHYAIQLISSGCLDALVDVLCRTSHKTNLVNSACLEVIAIVFQRAKGIIDTVGLDGPAVWRISTIINSENSPNQSRDEKKAFSPHRPAISLESLAKLPGNIALACWLVITRGTDLKRLAMVHSNSSYLESTEAEDHGVKRVVVGRMGVLEELISLVELVLMQHENRVFSERYQSQMNQQFNEEYQASEPISRIGTVESSAAAAAVAVAVGRQQLDDNLVGQVQDDDSAEETTEEPVELQENQSYGTQETTEPRDVKTKLEDQASTSGSISFDKVLVLASQPSAASSSGELSFVPAATSTEGSTNTWIPALENAKDTSSGSPISARQSPSGVTNKDGATKSTQHQALELKPTGQPDALVYPTHTQGLTPYDLCSYPNFNSQGGQDLQNSPTQRNQRPEEEKNTKVGVSCAGASSEHSAGTEKVVRDDSGVVDKMSSSGETNGSCVGTNIDLETLQTQLQPGHKRSGSRVCDVAGSLPHVRELTATTHSEPSTEDTVLAKEPSVTEPVPWPYVNTDEATKKRLFSEKELASPTTPTFAGVYKAQKRK